MKLKLEGDSLILVPESAADHAEIESAFGVPYDEVRRGGREFNGAAYGKDISLQPDGSIDIGIREAFWNRDD
jgi:hypothetical protein